MALIIGVRITKDGAWHRVAGHAPSQLTACWRKLPNPPHATQAMDDVDPDIHWCHRCDQRTPMERIRERIRRRASRETPPAGVSPEAATVLADVVRALKEAFPDRWERLVEQIEDAFTRQVPRGWRVEYHPEHLNFRLYEPLGTVVFNGWLGPARENRS